MSTKKNGPFSVVGRCQRISSPLEATVPQITDCLVHLHRDKGLSFSAVKGYHFPPHKTYPC